ncbi:DNA-directed RNA polymerase subunit delta [Texas Phoenix palm phytoplasma]|uniref:RNAP delta factor n=1 Tax=Texas Phoenix palm phytoplasma TaxID=176709 RepID=A0ABS5BIE1_9MOLU|nr:DNA-directed RNA polymerase subunit delta [Texas Phoenix palm phytoplasma]MBP3059345.1 DNA-directed RNA polymerase subunit delta [Texas Phoenix palm phytoplasma]
MKKKEHKNNFSDESMIDICYDILKENRLIPMPIKTLVKKVFQIKKIDIKNYEKFSQLYLDIVSSGRFMFYGNDLWGIKKNNLFLLDKNNFVSEEAVKEKKISSASEKEDIIDFDEFVLDKTNDLEDDSIIKDDDKEEINSPEQEELDSVISSDDLKNNDIENDDDSLENDIDIDDSESIEN